MPISVPIKLLFIFLILHFLLRHDHDSEMTWLYCPGAQRGSFTIVGCYHLPFCLISCHRLFAITSSVMVIASPLLQICVILRIIAFLAMSVGGYFSVRNTFSTVFILVHAALLFVVWHFKEVEIVLYIDEVLLETTSLVQPHVLCTCTQLICCLYL